MPMILFQTITTSIVVATLACDNQNWTPATSTHSSVPSTVVVSSYPSLNCIPSYHRCWNHYPQYLIVINWQSWHIIIYHHRHLKYIVPLRQLPCQIPHGSSNFAFVWLPSKSYISSLQAEWPVYLSKFLLQSLSLHDLQSFHTLLRYFVAPSMLSVMYTEHVLPPLRPPKGPSKPLTPPTSFILIVGNLL